MHSDRQQTNGPLGVRKASFLNLLTPPELTASSVPNPRGPPSDLQVQGRSSDGQAMLIVISLYLEGTGVCPHPLLLPKANKTPPPLFYVLWIET